MASFDAGSITARIIFDDSQMKKGGQTVDKTTKGMTASFVKAQLIVMGLTKTFQFLNRQVGEIIKNYDIQTQANIQLNAVLKSTGGVAGIAAQEAKNLSMELQKVTTFGDELILSGENLLLTFTNIGKDIFPMATETMLDMSQALGQDLKSSAIQLGKALQDPILGVTALRRVGVNFNEAQTDVIKNLVKTGETAKAQALILKELQTEFGGSARAARESFGGALKYAGNLMSDFKEDLGSIIEYMGTDLVKAFNKAGEKKTFSLGILEAIHNIDKALYNFLIVPLDHIHQWIVWRIPQAFRSLQRAVNTAAEGIKETLLAIVDPQKKIIDVVKDTAFKFEQIWFEHRKVIENYDTQLTQFHKAELKKKEDAYLKSKNFILGIVDEQINGTIQKTKKFTAQELEEALEREKIALEEKEKRKSYLDDLLQKIYESTTERTILLKEEMTKAIAIANEMGVETLGIRKYYEDQITKLVEEENQKRNNKFMEWFNSMGQKIINATSFVLSQIQSIMNSIANVINMNLQNELEEITAQGDEKLEKLQQQKEDKLTNIEDEYIREKELLNQKLADGLITQQEYDAQVAILEQQKADKKVLIETQMNTKIDEQDKKNRDKRNQKKKEMFEAQKANQIANVWIQFAIGVIAAWAQSIASLGPIAGAIFAAVLTGIMTGVAIAQTVVISNQKYIPEKATGGTASGLTRINEKGGELVVLPDNSLVIPNDISMQIARSTGKSGNNYVTNFSFAGANIGSKKDMRIIAEYVSKEFAKVLRGKK